MKLVKPLLLIIPFILFHSAGINAQSLIKKDTSAAARYMNQDKKSSILNPNKMSLKLDMGIGFVGGSSSGMYTYLSPFMRYSVSPKFKLDVGGTVCQGSNSLYNAESGTNGITSFSLFARGNYLLSDKVSLNGTAYKTFFPNPSSSTDITNRYANDNSGFSFGMNYKINKKMTVGAQISMSKTNTNYYPFGSQPSVFSSFPYDNSFHPGIFGW